MRSIVLDDHFVSESINAGVAARAGFVGTFGDQAQDELDALRRDFVRKAVLAGTDRVVRPLLRAGRSVDELADLTLGELPPTAELAALRLRRRELGLPSEDGDRVLVDVATGEPVAHDEVTLRLHLGRARLSRVNIEANGSICRGMLAGRYGGTPGVTALGHGTGEDTA